MTAILRVPVTVEDFREEVGAISDKLCEYENFKDSQAPEVMGSFVLARQIAIQNLLIRDLVFYFSKVVENTRYLKSLPSLSK